MSGSDQSWLHPPPPQQPDLRQGTQDTRYYDFGPDLRLISDPIATLTSVTVARVDGLPTGVNDLTITPAGQTPPWLDTAGFVVNWWEGVGSDIAATGTVSYAITVAFVTVAGRHLTYDCLQDVVAELG